MRQLRALMLTLSLLVISPQVLRAQSSPTDSLSAREVFARTSPSVFVVEALDGNGSVKALGSAVAISSREVVTNNHVVEGASKVRLRQGDKGWEASIATMDATHDICRISAATLAARPAVVSSFSTVKVGDRVYAIGAPEGLELSLSEGLVSGIRTGDSGESLIQTSAPISHGSSGGGLFNDRAELIGITTFYVKGGQNLNFAIPSDWILGRTAMALKHDLPSTPSKGVAELFQDGQDAFDAQDWNRAIAIFGQVLNENPDDWLAWQRLGHAHLRIGQKVEAFESLKHAVRIKPDFGSGWRDLGWTALSQALDEQVGGTSYRERASTAEGYLKKAITYSPEDPDAWHYYGMAVGVQDRHAEARDAFKKSLQLRPNDPTVLFALGCAYSSMKDRRSLKAIYDQLKTVSPEEANNFASPITGCLKN